MTNLADRAGTRRPGFEKLLAAICEGRVGAVLSLEASRPARNGRDWHKLLEFCGLVGTLIVDEDGVYDAASPNDRLLLGTKGTMSEMKLSVFRQRSTAYFVAQTNVCATTVLPPSRSSAFRRTMKNDPYS